MPGDKCRPAEFALEQLARLEQRLQAIIETSPEGARTEIVARVQGILDRFETRARASLPRHGCGGDRCLRPALDAARGRLSERAHVEPNQRLALLARQAIGTGDWPAPPRRERQPRALPAPNTESIPTAFTSREKQSVQRQREGESDARTRLF